MGIPRGLFALGLVACLLQTPGASFALGPKKTTENNIVFISDIDGTLTEHRNDAFTTPIKLFRANQRGYATQALPTGPETVLVSQKTFEELMDSNVLARGEGQLGDVNHTFKTVSGEKVAAGFYYFEPSLSFEGFAQSGEKGALFQFFEKISKAKTNSTDWQGPVWNLAQLMLQYANVEFGMLSARGEDMEPLLDLLAKKGIFPSRPSPGLSVALSNPKSDRFGQSHVPIAQRKVNVLKELVEEASAMHLSDVPENYILSPDGDRQQLARTFIFADDEPRNVQAVFEFFAHRARQKNWRLIPLKFIIINAGTPEQVVGSGRPRISVITASGNAREAQPLEVIQSLNLKKKLSSSELTRLGLIRKATRGELCRLNM